MMTMLYVSDMIKCRASRNRSCRVSTTRKGNISSNYPTQDWWEVTRAAATSGGLEGRDLTSQKGSPRAFSSRWVLMSVCVVCLVTTAEAKVIQGFLKTSEKWAFLTRFCFLSNDGAFTFEVEYNIEYAMEKLLLYYDSPHQWPAVYKSSKTCEEKEAVMKKENNQFINLTLISASSECEVVRLPGDKAFYHCKGTRSFRSVRERWWFIAVSNCDTNKGLELSYRITMTNGYSFWYKHFSADEFYVLRTDLTALGLQLSILFLSLLASAELKSRQLLHTTYRLYMVSLVAQVFALVFLSVHYARYGFDGVGLHTTKLLGRLLHTLSTIMMVLVLLLMAKGFNITRGRLRQASAVRLTVFMCLYCTTYISLFIYEQEIFDPGEVLYLYESPAGYGLLVLRSLAWCMFLYACFFTIKHYPEKAGFYCPFFAFYTLWFLSGPVVIVISNHVIDKWVREKVVNGVDLSITLLGHVFFLFLTRPSAANRNFPYHVRTTQITALETSGTGVVGNNTLDAFSAHTYAPDLPQPKTYAAPDLFLVSGAVEMIPLPGPRSIVKDDKSFPHRSRGSLVFQECSTTPRNLPVGGPPPVFQDCSTTPRYLPEEPPPVFQDCSTTPRYLPEEPPPVFQDCSTTPRYLPEEPPPVFQECSTTPRSAPKSSTGAFQASKPQSDQPHLFN
ncbi:transmembrane protein 145 [Procambarus clarkii]|uniref:transmembrane protein 145 n=1 Tax=Procambarus clarkii TaxID=6728 RepID=UPI001E673581|nr:transmembrane protein 145-like [Procambarus clarkii]